MPLPNTLVDPMPLHQSLHLYNTSFHLTDLSCDANVVALRILQLHRRHLTKLLEYGHVHFAELLECGQQVGLDSLEVVEVTLLLMEVLKKLLVEVVELTLLLMEFLKKLLLEVVEVSLLFLKKLVEVTLLFLKKLLMEVVVAEVHLVAEFQYLEVVEVPLLVALLVALLVSQVESQLQ